MVLKNSIYILVSNFNIVYKILFYILIIAILMASLFVVLYIPTLKPMVDEIASTGIVGNFKQGAKEFVTVNDNYVNTQKDIVKNIEQVREIIYNNTSKIVVTFVLIVIIFAIAKFFLANANYLISDIINSFMNSKMKVNFSASIAMNIKKSTFYGLFNVLFLTPIDLLFSFFVVGFFMATYEVFGFLTPPLTVILAVSLWSLKFTFFSTWLPSIINDKSSIFKCLRNSIKRGFSHFGDYFGRFFIYSFMLIVFSVCFTFSTLGAGSILVFPINLIFFRIVELILYYKENGKHFYINKKDVINAESL